jgi:DNA-binding NarL/FixJ family response regulator
MAGGLRILLITQRPGIRALFANLLSELHEPIEVDVLGTDAEAFRTHARELKHASAAVVDLPDEASAILTLGELNACRPDLPIVALLCCPGSATSPTLEALATAGVASVIDLHATPEDVLVTLEETVNGASVIHLRLNYDQLPRYASNGAPHENGSERPPLSEQDMELLSLLVDGLGDQEIAHRLYLSPHTVKHRIEQLRAKTGKRNRIALAAWAGQLELSPPKDPPPKRRENRAA